MVVLPDFQGIGLGSRFYEFAGEYLKQRGKTYIDTTSHPATIGHRLKNKKWIMTRKPGHVSFTKSGNFTKNRKFFSINCIF